MTSIQTLARRFAAPAMLALATAAPISTAHATTPPDDDLRRPVRVTAREVDASNQKVGMAYAALGDMWTNQFRQIGARFAVPRVARYDGSAFTSCGPIGPSNAIYCPRNNTIYYDEVFVAGMQKLAANAVGTDGDMAAVGIIAHEMGHAVATQLGRWSRDSYKNESTADCLAGAFAHQSEIDGSLEPGDVDEAVYGMSLGGDPTPTASGDERRNARNQAKLARQAHGTREQRMQNFRDGLSGGPGACLSEFR